MTDASFGVHPRHGSQQRASTWWRSIHPELRAPLARFGESARLAESIAAVVDHCEVLVLATPWPSLLPSAPASGHRGVHDLFDCLREPPVTSRPGARLHRSRGTGYKLHGTDA